MRHRCSAVGMLIVCVSWGWAAPGSDSSGGEPLSRPEAEIYAVQMVRAAKDVSDRYVNEVSQCELLCAALTALYRIAELPAPAHLKADLEKAVDGNLVAVVTDVRQKLGKRAALDSDTAILAGYQAMSKCLDSYSVVVYGGEWQRGIGKEINSGVGIELHDNGGSGPVRIKTVVPGGPAQRAGLLPGDEITHLAGKLLEKQTPDQVMLCLNTVPRTSGTGPDLGFAAPAKLSPSTPITASPAEITLRRQGRAKAWALTLDAEEFQPETVLGVRRNLDNSWNYWLDRDKKIAHVRIDNLGPNTAYELRRLLEELTKHKVAGVLLDLRWCPGGFLKTAVDVAGLFLKEGTTIATVRGRKDGETKHIVEEGTKFLEVPLVVLVSGDTSGGAELIAASLQDHQRAVIVGRRTVGKGSVQTLLALPVRDAGFKITSAVFIRPNGKNLHRFPNSRDSDDWGVLPDPGHEFRTTPELNRQLRDWWQQQSLRPGSSDRPLPLDDPEADVVQQLALKVLTAK